MSVAVVAALEQELSPLALRLAGRRPAARGRSLPCRTDGRKVRLMVTGDGAARAGEGARRLLAEEPCGVLLGIGVAGGLSSDLAVGETVVLSRVLDASSGRVTEPPPSLWLARGRQVAGVRDATAVSTRRIAADRASKARLAALAPAPAVVDLESSAWSAAAVSAGIPFVIARVVSDAWDEDLPLDFERLRDADGVIDRRRIVLSALVRPRRWRALLGLRRTVRRAAEGLADWAIEVIAG